MRFNFLGTMLSISTLALIGYGISFLSQMVISGSFGTTSDIDAYYLALSIINLAWFFAGPINEAAIPGYFQLKEQDGQAASEYFSKVVNSLILACMVSVCLILLCLPVLTSLVSSSGFQGGSESLKGFILLMAPTALMNCLILFLGSTLNCHNAYIVQSVGRISGSALGLVLLYLLVDRVGVRIIAISLNVSLAVMVIIQGISLARLNVVYKPMVGFKLDNMFYRVITRLLIIYFISSLTIMEERFVYGMLGTGVIAAFGYASAMLAVPQQVLLMGAMNISWTRIMERLSSNGMDSCIDDLLNTATHGLAVALAIMATFMLFSREIVYVVLYRGSFNLESLDKTSLILRYLAVSLPTYMLGSLLGRFVISLRMVGIVVVQGLILALSAALMYLAGYLAGSIPVVASALTVSTAVNVAYVIYIIGKQAKLREPFMLFLLRIPVLVVVCLTVSIPLSAMVVVDVFESKAALAANLALYGLVLFGFLYSASALSGNLFKRLVLKEER